MASTFTARVGVIGSIWAEVAELAENPLVQRVISVFDKVDHRVDGKRRLMGRMTSFDEGDLF